MLILNMEISGFVLNPTATLLLLSFLDFFYKSWTCITLNPAVQYSGSFMCVLHEKIKFLILLLAANATVKSLAGWLIKTGINPFWNLLPSSLPLPLLFQSLNLNIFLRTRRLPQVRHFLVFMIETPNLTYFIPCGDHKHLIWNLPRNKPCYCLLYPVISATNSLYFQPIN